ncbi:MAG: homocysteine S-methyltransferase family protein [Chloroflexota bacterium]
MARLSELIPRPLLADAAMGTELIRRGAGSELPLELLNLTQPERVQAVHRACVAAGAQVLFTNTFSAALAGPMPGGLAGSLPGRPGWGSSEAAEKLGDRISGSVVAGHGWLFDQTSTASLQEVNAAAVRLARATGGPATLVAGSIAVAAARTVPSYAAQAEALAGADFLALETATSLPLLRRALEGVRQVSQLPLLCLLSFDRQGRLDGLPAAAVAHALWEAGCDAFGGGCGFGPAHALPLLAELCAAAPQALIAAKPNAGLPVQEAAGLHWPVSSTEFGRFASAALHLGVRLVGGCCGTRPAHIQSMREAFSASDQGQTPNR